MGNVLELSDWRTEGNPDRICYESRWVVKPMQGREIEIKMHRTRYWIKSSERTYFCEKSSTLFLYSNEQFEYQLAFIFPDRPYSRLLCSVETGAPFYVNGVEAERVYLHSGDRIQIGSHHLFFPKKDEREKRKKIEATSAVVKSKLPIYLEGETGTGKTSMALKIHQDSGVGGSFVHLNLSSLNAQLFESELFGYKKGAFTGAIQDKAGVLREAHLGTLFLDEINSLSLELQTKLLLVLETQKIRPVGSNMEIKTDFRLITSSNENLENLVANGKMRKDFYFRITSGEKLLLPRLNSTEKYFYETLSNLELELDVVIPRSLKEFYFGVTWEGNIREIKSYLQKKKILQGRKLSYCENDENLILKNYKAIIIQDKKEENLKTLQQLKKDYVQLVFERSGRSVSETSKILKVAPGTVRAILYEAKM